MHRIIRISILCILLGLVLEGGCIMATFGKIGARPLVKKWGASDYVKTGLIALWDGTENAGFGIHDPNATSLANLVGGNALTPANSKYTITNDSMHVKSCILTATVSGLNDAYVARQLTIQIVARSNSSDTSTASTSLFSVSGNNQPKVWGTSWQVSCSKFGIGQGSGWDTKLNATYGNIVSVSLVVSPSGSNVVGTFYNGTTKGNVMSRPVSANTTDVDKIGIAGYADNARAMLDADIFSVRVYNKTLSESEISHNYTVDKLRFNLT